MNIKLVKILILPILIATVESTIVNGCTCPKLKSIRKEIKSSEFIAIGRIINMELYGSAYARLESESTNSYDLRKYKVALTSVFKGTVTQDTITLFSGIGLGDCGTKLDENKVYIIYGYKENAPNWRPDYPSGQYIFWTDRCKRTAIYSEVEEMKIRKHLKIKKNDP